MDLRPTFIQAERGGKDKVPQECEQQGALVWKTVTFRRALKGEDFRRVRGV